MTTAASAGVAKTAAYTNNFRKADCIGRDGQPLRMNEKMTPRPGSHSRF